MTRYLLKLSGEALGGDAGIGIEPLVLKHYCDEIEAAVREGIQVAVVLGGGNLFRGAHLAQAGMDRVVGDRMGMLATVMNGLALNDFLQRRGIASRLFSAMPMAGMVEGYQRDLAQTAIANGEVVILTGGTGNPFFTTDTAACLRGVELGVDAILKATNVDGVYSADPKKDAAAQRFEHISYQQVLAQELAVMDLTAIVLCKENALPLIVFDASESRTLTRLAAGEQIGTRVDDLEALG
ncbi:MAG: UMP kinase [Gammaproteobacteria bacterium TMED30]|nr:UMP kinase [Gammaproteobacteria bacterium]OUU06510.1 MAG: UMP kinase [Gammaproteobacteria bacterium TMED30]